MDTKFIQRYGAEIACYRLRTARQKKRMQYEDFDKYLIQINKQQDQLYQQKNNLGWEPLSPPVQKGWVRQFVLREDVAVGKHAEFFTALLEKINTYQYDWKKDFKKKQRKYGRKIYVPREQYLLKPCSYRFKRLNFSEAEQQFFYEQWDIDKYGNWMSRYVFAEPWRFVLRIKPNMIDKVRKNDAELERKLQTISNYLEKNDLGGRMAKLTRGHYQFSNRDRTEQQKNVSLYKNRSLVQVLDIIQQSRLTQ